MAMEQQQSYAAAAVEAGANDAEEAQVAWGPTAIDTLMVCALSLVARQASSGKLPREIGKLALKQKGEKSREEDMEGN